MLIKRTVCCVVLSLVFYGSAMADTNGSSAPSGDGKQNGFSVPQEDRHATENLQRNPKEKSKDATSGKPSENGKKPSMVDFCRKNPC